jgi:hypothetical protein
MYDGIDAAIQKKLPGSRLTANGTIAANRTSVVDNTGVLHGSLKAWKESMGVHKSMPVIYMVGPNAGREPGGVSRELTAAVKRLLEFSRTPVGE